MDIERKALYNLIRMNWFNEPNLNIEPWQVEDYRSLKLPILFDSLLAWDISIDEQEFLNIAETADSPEMLSDILTENLSLEPPEQDQVFLLVFEIWRRLLPEKQCLSVFCDELDHQIFLYDSGDLSAAEGLQDAIANLQMIMDENLDEGAKPVEIFETLSSACANDLKTFLYDYIAEQIDSEHTTYALELVEGFSPYMKGNKWFELLKIRLLEFSDSEEARLELRKLVQKVVKEEDLPFNLEVLAFIVQAGENGEFNKMVRATVSILEKEEDFADLLTICADYYNCIDDDEKEQQVQKIIDDRDQHSWDKPLETNDKDLTLLLGIVKK